MSHYVVHKATGHVVPKAVAEEHECLEARIAAMSEVLWSLVEARGVRELEACQKQAEAILAQIETADLPRIG